MLSTPGPSRGPSSSSRHRDRDRARGGTEAGTPRRAGTPPLPTYEPPIAHLNESGQQALLVLLRAQGLRQLKTHLQHVETKLTDSAGEINEKLTDAREKARKRRERERERGVDRSMTEAGDGEGGEGNLDDGSAASEETSRLKGLEERIEALTGRLDASMRRAIDSETRVDGLGEILGALQNEVDANVNTGNRRQRQRRRTRRGADEEEEGEDGDEGGLYEATPEPEVDREEISLRRKLAERMDEEQAKWENLSLTERFVSRYLLTYPRYRTLTSLHEQLLRKQRLQRLLPHHPRLQTPRRCHSSTPTPLNLVRPPRRHQRLCKIAHRRAFAKHPATTYSRRLFHKCRLRRPRH